jgi:hypothetical protein
MEMNNESALVFALREELKIRLAASHERIIYCVSQLQDDQVWWRPMESMNSIGNLILHLVGNLRQWVVQGAMGGPDHRNRPLEFAERTQIPKHELLASLQQVVEASNEVLSGLTEGLLFTSRRIQGFEETVLSAILNSLMHFTGHAQEIVYITRIQMGSSYHFAWSPQTPEEGAA